MTFLNCFVTFSVEIVYYTTKIAIGPTTNEINHWIIPHPPTSLHTSLITPTPTTTTIAGP